MYDKHDQGVQGSPGKLRNLPVCTVVAKGQKDCPICEAKFGQKKRGQAMVVSTGERRRKTDGREYDTPPPIPCTPKELDLDRKSVV